MRRGSSSLSPAHTPPCPWGFFVSPEVCSGLSHHLDVTHCLLAHALCLTAHPPDLPPLWSLSGSLGVVAPLSSSPSAPLPAPCSADSLYRILLCLFIIPAVCVCAHARVCMCVCVNAHACLCMEKPGTNSRYLSHFQGSACLCPLSSETMMPGHQSWL